MCSKNNGNFKIKISRVWGVQFSFFYYNDIHAPEVRYNFQLYSLPTLSVAVAKVRCGGFPLLKQIDQGICSWILGQKQYLTMPQPPYSPDMAPGDSFTFLKIKRTLKGRRFTRYTKSGICISYVRFIKHKYIFSHSNVIRYAVLYDNYLYDLLYHSSIVLTPHCGFPGQ